VAPPAAAARLCPLFRRHPFPNRALDRGRPRRYIAAPSKRRCPPGAPAPRRPGVPAFRRPGTVAPAGHPAAAGERDGVRRGSSGVPESADGRRTVRISESYDSYNAAYVEEQYERYLRSPGSVDET